MPDLCSAGISRPGRHSAARLVAAALLVLLLAANASAGNKHIFWAKGSPNAPNPASLTSDIIYHGGNAGPGAIGVENKPAIYVIFWGPQWQSGFTTTDVNGVSFTSQQLQNYVTSFLKNLGGTSWAAIHTEYCNNVPAGTTSCDGVAGANFVTNPRNQLKGAWTDPTPVPDQIVTFGLAENTVDDPIAMEAMRASAHFGYDPQATYIVLTPPQATAVGQFPVYCGYHTQTTSVNGAGNPYRLQYAFIPFLNSDLNGTSCGMNAVNTVSDSFGHGVFDGYSIVIGHEYSEAVTDPDNFSSVQDGWNDAQTSENGDKCAWTGLGNVPMFNKTTFAVQPMWSNRAADAGADGCVLSAPTSPHAMPVVGVQPPAVLVCGPIGGFCPGVAAGQPMPVNMAYFGWKVQTSPKIYLVLWGWGQAGAFDHSNALHPSSDPDGVGALMQRFIAAIGGTSWGNTQTQYYQYNQDGTYSFVGNPGKMLYGVWHDDSDPIQDNLTPLDLAREAARAAQHFHVNAADFTNTQIVVATPQKMNEAGFNQGSYCAWHDFTTPVAYPGVTAGIPFVNMPYVLNAGGSCGQDFVNPAPGGDVDGVTIVLGHEIAETLTDPGAESKAGQVHYGGWYDYQGWENGDKCAWVGDGLQVPGAPFNMVGNDGRAYPVQTLWSNKSLQGAGYCSQGF